MKNEDFEPLLNRLIASTRSPRGHFAASESWKLLEQRMHRTRTLQRFRLRAASVAAVVLLCVASWAAYRLFVPVPSQPQTVVTGRQTEPATCGRMLTFDRQPLQEIARQLSETFQTEIRIEDDSLRQYRMTATFHPDETLLEILHLLEEAGNFTYRQTNDTIILTSKLN